MHQEASNNINSQINQINIADKESALIIANALMKLSNKSIALKLHTALTVRCFFFVQRPDH